MGAQAPTTVNQDDGAPNHDGTYHELLSTRGRVAVVGSAVGGTGASVAPTLAQRFADEDAGGGVMAVMVLNWFRFAHKGLDEGVLERAQRRDRSMVENADSAFAYYGRSLAGRVATVPVGVADPTAIKVRRYTSDTRQPIDESFVHGVAALCCLHHFLDSEPRAPGLYQMGAEDPTRLGGGNRLPGSEGNDTVQSLANQAATLADLVDVFARTLTGTGSGGVLGVVPAICREVQRLGAPDRIGRALGTLAAGYRGHLEWMKDVLGAEPRRDLSLTREVLSRKRLATHRLEVAARGDMGAEDAAALALLQWTADWIRDFSRGEGAASLVVTPALETQRGYWPPLVGHDSLDVAAEQAGRLTQVPDQNVSGTVQGFIRRENIAQNGWPDPLAAADHFRYAVEHDHPTERRQLEMLLVGVVLGKLTLQDVPSQENPPLLSLEHLVNEYRQKRRPELARVAVVHPHRDGDVVLGFNSPLTLLCPAPIANDERRERAWSALWQALTGSEQPRDWRTEEIGEWRPAGLAVRQIRTWIENLKRAHGGAAPPWTSVFADDSAWAPATGGRGRTLSVYWGTGTEASLVAIALPTASSGDYWPDEDTPLIPETDLFQTQAPALRSVTTDAGTFQMVEFTLPDQKEATRAFWREHLDHLQGRGSIAAFGARPGDRRLAVLTADQQSAAILDNTILLDRDDLMVRDCTPLRQDPVPGSSTRPGGVRYPDYPLRSDYLGLVETDAGDRVVDVLKRGERVRVMPPSVDAGPRPPSTGGGRPVSTSSSWLKEGSGQAARAARNLVSAGQRVVNGITQAVRDLRDGEHAESTGRRTADTRPRGEPSRGGETRRPAGKATWELRLAGRTGLLPITLPVPQVDAADDEDSHHRAHWMVWPRFRSKERPYWRAYYVYEHCTDARLRLSTLWFDPDDDCVRRCRAPERPARTRSVSAPATSARTSAALPWRAVWSTGNPGRSSGSTC